MCATLSTTSKWITCVFSLFMFERKRKRGDGKNVNTKETLHLSSLLERMETIE